MRLARGITVRCAVPGGRPLYGRIVPGDYPPGLVCVRLSADHTRGRKGERVYALAKNTAPWGRARHASGVHRSWWTRLPQGQHAG